MTRIAVCLALAAAVVGVASAATVEPRRGHALQMQSHRLGGCSGATAPRVARSVRLPGKPGPLLVRRRTLWVGIQGSRPGRPGRLLALDAASGRLRKAFRLPFDPLRLAAGFGSLWITGQGGSRRYAGVLEVDPRSGRVLRVVRGADGLGTALAATTRSIWVGGPDRYPPGHPEKAGVYLVYRIDPRRGAVVGRVRLRSTVIDLASDGSSLWIAGWYAIVKLSAHGEVLLRAPIVGSGWSVTRVKGGAWVAHTFNGTRRDRVPPPARELFRMRAPATPHLTRIPLDQSPWQVSATGGGTWVALGEYSHEVMWVPDEPTPQARTVPVRGIVRGIQAIRGGVWVAQLAPNQLSKVC